MFNTCTCRKGKLHVIMTCHSVGMILSVYNNNNNYYFYGKILVLQAKITNTYNYIKVDNDDYTCIVPIILGVTTASCVILAIDIVLIP